MSGIRLCREVIAPRSLAAALIVMLAACAPASGGEGIRDSGAGLPPGVSSHFSQLLALEDPDAFRAAARERGFVTTVNGVVLDIQTEALDAGDRDALDLPGLRVRGFHPRHERIDAVAATPAAIRAVAALPFVRAVAPSFGATTSDGSDTY